MNLLDLIFSRKCVGCGKEGSYFCPACTKTIKLVRQVCPVCERQTPFGQTHSFCLTRNSPDGLISFFDYNGIIRNAVHQLKYKFVTDLEKEFWQIIVGDIEKRKEEMLLLKRFIDDEKPIVVPVPLHRQKENLRGFNQSSLFGKRMADLWKLSFSDKILVRYRKVESQTKLTQKERAENIKGIFTINSMSLRAMQEHGEAISVILVDDVWTTGSTLKEAARVLKEVGIRKVWGITIIR